MGENPLRYVVVNFGPKFECPNLVNFLLFDISTCTPNRPTFHPEEHETVLQMRFQSGQELLPSSVLGGNHPLATRLTLNCGNYHNLACCETRAPWRSVLQASKPRERPPRIARSWSKNTHLQSLKATIVIRARCIGSGMECRMESAAWKASQHESRPKSGSPHLQNHSSRDIDCHGGYFHHQTCQ